MKKPTLALFLELGGSFEEWNDVGFFSREISLYNRLAKDYFEKIYIFTYGSTKDLSYSKYLEKNIIVIPRGMRSSSYFVNFLYELSVAFKYRSLLNQCDIIKTNQNSGSIAASISKMLLPRKLLVIRSGYIGSELGWEKLSLTAKLYYFFAENTAYRICDHILIPARDADILTGKYPFTRRKLTVLNNFINIELFKKIPKKAKVWDLIYVARLSDAKNHLGLLHAIQGLNLQVLFIGSGENEAKINKIAIESKTHVTIIRSVPNNELPDYFNSAKICAFSSLYEGNPKSLLEAMSCEIPVVALDSPGVSNIIQNGKNGLIGPSESLRLNISRLLNDQRLRDTLGFAARKTVIDSFSLESILEKEKTVYSTLLRL